MSEFIFKEQMPTPVEWVELRIESTWEIYNEEIFQESIKNTLYAITVYDQSTIIGMGRIIGDGQICFYLQDIIIKKAYRGKGIGKKIVCNLLSYIKIHAQHNAMIALMSSYGNESFYEQFGFIRRPNEHMGCGMIYTDI